MKRKLGAGSDWRGEERAATPFEVRWFVAAVLESGELPEDVAAALRLLSVSDIEAGITFTGEDGTKVVNAGGETFRPSVFEMILGAGLGWLIEGRFESFGETGALVEGSVEVLR